MDWFTNNGVELVNKSRSYSSKEYYKEKQTKWKSEN
jgi:hypothetical protein